MTDFNPDTFLTEEQNVILETEFTAIPEGDYDGIIKDIKPDTTPKGSHLLAVTWLIDSEEVREHTGMPEPTCRQTIWLDLDENGKLAGGSNKNIGLGKLRDALGQNDGSPWSPSMLLGQPAYVHVAPDKTGQYSNVVQVAPR